MRSGTYLEVPHQRGVRESEAPHGLHRHHRAVVPQLDTEKQNLKAVYHIFVVA